MVRVLLYVTLLAGLFAGAVLWTGNAVGAFEPVKLPQHAPGSSSTEKANVKKPHQAKHKKH